MLKTKRRILVSLLSSVIVVLAIVGVWLFSDPGTASAAENLEAIMQASAMPGLLGEGYLNHGGGWGGRGFKDSSIDYNQLLADELGITVEELETAYETARDAAVGQAVADGLIIQEQADTMKSRDGFGARGRWGKFDFGRAPKGVEGSAIDENALLADALGLTVEELQAARDAANQAATDQALEEGLITQEQLDEMQTRKDLMSYIDRNSLLAGALGMTAEEVQAALDKGKTLSDLMSDQGLDVAAMREAMQAAHAEALAQAVADGVITQEQADEMQSGRGWGMMPSGMMPGSMPHGRMPRGDRVPPEGFEMPEDFEGFPGCGGLHQMQPGLQDGDDTSATESGWRMQRPAFQGGNDA